MTKDYLTKIYKEKKNESLNINSWQCMIFNRIPEQLNGTDCEVYTCLYARLISKRILSQSSFNQVLIK